MYVLKLKITSLGTAAEQKAQGDTVAHLKSQAWRAANIAVNAQIVADIARQRRELEPAFAEGQSAVTENPMTMAARDIKAMFPRMPSAVSAAIAYRASRHYVKHKAAVLSGVRRAPRYRAGMPVPWNAWGVKFLDDDMGRHIVRLSMGRGNEPLVYRVVYGNDSVGHRERVERLIAGQTTFGTVTLHTSRRGPHGLFLHVPTKESRAPVLIHPARSLAVHVGYESIVSTCFHDAEVNETTDVRHIGRRRDIEDKKRHFEDRRSRAMRAISRTKGGHGYRRRFRAIHEINNKEARWLRNCHHDVSAKVVAAAQWRRVGRIILEAYGTLPVESPERVQALATRPVYDLQALITQKGRSYGATVCYVEPVGMRDDEIATKHMLLQPEIWRVDDE